MTVSRVNGERINIGMSAPRSALGNGIGILLSIRLIKLLRGEFKGATDTACILVSFETDIVLVENKKRVTSSDKSSNCQRQIEVSAW